MALGKNEVPRWAAKLFKTDSGTPFIDLTGIPPQPLILKNALSRGGNYEDNTRSRPVKAGSSKYTGIYLDNYNSVRKPTWKAQSMVNGRVRSIGFYESEEDAAGDYARAAFKYKVQKNESKYGGLDLPEQSLIVSNSATGYKGVKKMKGRWQARITVEMGVPSKTLGTFDSAEEAAAIYARAAFYLKQRTTRGRRQEGGATVVERTEDEQIIDLKTSAIHV
ncbi:hypothetical protein ACHAW5_000844 [Stephanodiscus triporus]|uniref:AP2/ERF domain-containing protein n=1 Tax=Stephanodiscus triporus TaxID=2934178 RepID=A0ABD3NY80_9STRA